MELLALIKRSKCYTDVYIMAKNLEQLKESLWTAANNLRANSPLSLNQFLEPVLGLIFLKFADVRFAQATKELEEERAKKNSVRQRPLSKTDYHAKHILYIPKEAMFTTLLELPEDATLGQHINDAMKAIEAANTELAGVLPKSYQILDNETIISLLKNFNSIPTDIEGDAFGQIYEYFLGKFAISDGRSGGEFFTPSSIVKLIVEIIEPYEGRVYDPACGSGGMFVQSHEFVRQHLKNGAKKNAASKLSIYGQEKTEQTVRISKMNLALHGLSGDIKQGNTFYEDEHDSVGKFDFTMANPPFNVSGIDYGRIAGDKRYPYGLPKQDGKGTDNGNYLWIQHFWSSLSPKGRSGFVMANSASDAGGREKEMRKQLVEHHAVDCIVAVGPNMFYNVTLPVTLWFLDKGKKKTERKDSILFIDARNIFTQIDRAHRTWTEEQIDQITAIVRSYRGEEGYAKYEDVAGLCKVVSADDVIDSDYSLNPGRYVGVIDTEIEDADYIDTINSLYKKFIVLTGEAGTLEKRIDKNFKELFKNG